MLITQKICTFRMFHLYWSIIRGMICCAYIHVGDSFNGGLFQGGWILFDYIESIHLEYFSRELFQGSNVGWINIFFMEEGYCVSTYEIITMNDYFKEDGHLLIS